MDEFGKRCGGNVCPSLLLTRNSFPVLSISEGVLVAKKDFNAPKHPEIDVPNLQVCKLMLSLKSSKYVTEQFAWRHYYYYLTEEGIAYLRKYLHLPDEVTPATHKQKPS